MEKNTGNNRKNRKTKSSFGEKPKSNFTRKPSGGHFKKRDDSKGKNNDNTQNEGGFFPAYDKNVNWADKIKDDFLNQADKKRSASDKYKNKNQAKPFAKPIKNAFTRPSQDKTARPFANRSKDQNFSSRDERNNDRPTRPFFDKTKARTDRPTRSFEKPATGEFSKRNNATERGERPSRPFFSKYGVQGERPAHFRKNNLGETREKKIKNLPTFSDEIRLNKYIAAAGICSRREADNLILSGIVSVNGVVVNQLGAKVKKEDQVKYGDQRLSHEKKVYLVLNKPKDYITTTEDEKNRRTVMELVQHACKERIFPVGRLDRNTTGVLLFTNDGDLSMKLTHPKFKIKKLYHVVLDKNFTAADMQALKKGLELEDGVVLPDEVSYVDGAPKSEVGIEIHSGKNHIVRRIFEHLGYDVIKLDRVIFGNITKAELPRSTWRMLTPMEVLFLKNLKQA